MTTTPTKSVTAAVAAAIVGVAAPALLFLGAGTAHAIQDVSERSAIAILDHLPTPRECPSCGGFNPQPDPPGYPDPGSHPALIKDEENRTPPLIGNPDIYPGSQAPPEPH